MQQASKELEAGAGTQFDPVLVEAFLRRGIGHSAQVRPQRVALAALARRLSRRRARGDREPPACRPRGRSGARRLVVAIAVCVTLFVQATTAGWLARRLGLLDAPAPA